MDEDLIATQTDPFYNPANMKRLKESIQQMEQGKMVGKSINDLTRKKYSVVESCDHIGCGHNKVTPILDTISLDSAYTTANELNRTSNKRCPFCGNLLGYFPEQEEE